MERTADGYKLSTGREVYANGGIIGIGERASGSLFASQGYDGHLSGDDSFVVDAEDLDELFTPAERQEIAAYMIKLWQEWATLPLISAE